MPVLLYLLALAVFAQGTSEFVLSGLLTGIAHDLDVSLAEAGLLTSAFAIGMIVGAPAMAILARRFSARASLSCFLLVFILAHIVGALTDSFPLLLGTRIVAAVANAGFLAVSLSVVVRTVDVARRSRAVGIILAGSTLALIVGVPAGAFIGTAFGWRTTLWAIGALSIPALIAVALAAPAGADADAMTEEAGREPGRRSSVIEELRTLRSVTVQFSVGLAVLVNGATFAAFTYWASIATEFLGTSEARTPLLLGVFGLGAFLGVNVSGRFGDRHWRLLISVLSPMLVLGWAAMAVVLHSPGSLGGEPGIWVFALLQGFLSFALGSALIARIIASTRMAQTLGGSFATVALNLGAAIGPIIAGLTLDRFGYHGPILVSAVCAATAWIGWLVLRTRVADDM